MIGRYFQLIFHADNAGLQFFSRANFTDPMLFSITYFIESMFFTNTSVISVSDLTALAGLFLCLLFLLLLLLEIELVESSEELYRSEAEFWRRLAMSEKTLSDSSKSLELKTLLDRCLVFNFTRDL